VGERRGQGWGSGVGRGGGGVGVGHEALVQAHQEVMRQKDQRHVVIPPRQQRSS
jgi:hypothetical protein